MKRQLRLTLVIVGAMLLAGCATGVRIADLQNRPDRYHDRRVTVNGVVTTSFGVPLVPFQIYKVDDGSGEITVVSHGNRAPRKGSRVRVTGRLDDVATFGGNSVGLHIEERDREYRR
jgi:hypothetical protein